LEGKVIYRFWIGFLTGGLFLRLIAIGVEEIEKIRAGASCKMKMFCIGSKD
jgi:aconitase B